MIACFSGLTRGQRKTSLCKLGFGSYQLFRISSKQSCTEQLCDRNILCRTTCQRCKIIREQLNKEVRCERVSYAAFSRVESQTVKRKNVASENGSLVQSASKNSPRCAALGSLALARINSSVSAVDKAATGNCVTETLSTALIQQTAPVRRTWISLCAPHGTQKSAIRSRYFRADTNLLHLDQLKCEH